MRNFFAILLSFVSCLICYAEEEEKLQIVDMFKPYELTESDNSSIVSYLKKFVGDTIVMNFSDVSYLNVFKTSNPDTVWIKKGLKRIRN